VFIKVDGADEAFFASFIMSHIQQVAAWEHWLERDPRAVSGRIRVNPNYNLLAYFLGIIQPTTVKLALGVSYSSDYFKTSKSNSKNVYNI
jgi:hypothetical protein